MCPFTVCFTRKSKQKNLQYEMCKEQVKKQLNFDEIVKKFNELEFMKAILLNKEQIISFDYFEKSLVSIEKEITIDNRLMTELHQMQMLGEDKHLEILSSYFDSLTQETMTPIDDKIKKLLDSTL